MSDHNEMITATELQAEMESLRSLRRRSLSTNASPEGVLDPDLPSQLSSGTPSPPNSPGLSRTGSLSRRPSQTDPNRLPYFPSEIAASASVQPADNQQPEIDENLPLAQVIPSNFWLPARLHPELAPQEFKNFIKEQKVARQNSIGHDGSSHLDVQTDDAGERNLGPVGIARGLSMRQQGLRGKDGGYPTRKKSMLSKQYQPKLSESEDDIETAPERPYERLPESILEEDEEREREDPPRSPIAEPGASPFRAGSTRRGGMAALSLLTINPASEKKPDLKMGKREEAEDSGSEMSVGSSN
ncbi:hypothetical protein BT69DRAFT_1329185 [Atractiella rhizophila]|nr:hypothetical protein BT69DRAFT_1329185 [Atractiella rhizophila]